MLSKVKHYLQLNQAAEMSNSQPRLLVLEAFNQWTASVYDISDIVDTTSDCEATRTLHIDTGTCHLFFTFIHGTN